MPNAMFEIALFDGEETTSGISRYEPGAMLRGSVRITPDSDVSCNHVWVRLLWHTEGRGTRDEGEVGLHDLYQGQLAARTPLQYDFAFTLPREPWSYAGHLVNIVWEVVVSLDVSWSTDPTGRQPFILAPSA